MPPFFAIPNLAMNATRSSQLGGVFDSSCVQNLIPRCSHMKYSLFSSSESELEASRADNCDSSLSTDSSISSVSLSDDEEDEINGIPYSSDDTVRGRVPPNTPKNANTTPTSTQVRNSDGDQTGDVTPSTSSSLVRERRISRLSDELHTVLAPHTLGTLAHRRSMPDGNSYHYVHNELDYHMHYHQDNHPQHHPLKEHRQQRLPPPPQYHTFTHHEHNLCPAEYDRVDRWRIFAGTFTPSPVRSPDCGTPIQTPPRVYNDREETEGPEPMSPTLLLQKLRALSNDLNRVPGPSTAHPSVRRTAGRGRGANGGNGNVRVETARVNGAFDKRRKEILIGLAELADHAAQEISSASPSSPKGHSSWSSIRKQGRGGGASTRPSSRRPYEDSNWVVMDGETEMISRMGFHESSMSEVDCQWDAPKPKFLQKLFQ
jgi:hypothetical protein